MHRLNPYLQSLSHDYGYYSFDELTSPSVLLILNFLIGALANLTMSSSTASAYLPEAISLFRRLFRLLVIMLSNNKSLNNTSFSHMLSLLCAYIVAGEFLIYFSNYLLMWR